MTSKRNTIYLATLNRFGYNLVCTGLNKQKCIDAIMQEYVDYYITLNNEHPGSCYDRAYSYGEYNKEKTDYDYALEDISINELEQYKVSWN